VRISERAHKNSFECNGTVSVSFISPNAQLFSFRERALYRDASRAERNIVFAKSYVLTRLLLTRAPFVSTRAAHGVRRANTHHTQSHFFKALGDQRF
jgi:hypothetical protein